MKLFDYLAMLIILLCQPVFSQRIPDGYILQYQQGFSGGKSLSDFRFDNPALWGIFNVGGNSYLQSNGKVDSSSNWTLPANIAIIDNKIFGDFVLEAEIMPKSDSNGFRETCLFFGMKDLGTYYYIQLASLCDSTRHGIYLVKDSVNTRLTGSLEQPVIWKDKQWHKIRLERDIVKRTMLVFVDQMDKPILQIKDWELVMGMVGVGSFSSPGRFDNIKIWAPTVISNE